MIREKQFSGMQNQEIHKTLVRREFIEIPSFVFRDRSVAVLESLVEYMKDVQGFSYHEIALLLNRNDRTVWTVYRRAKLKRKGIIKVIKEKTLENINNIDVKENQDE